MKILCNRRKNKYTIVDTEDYEMLSRYQVYYASGHSKEYAFVFIDGRRVPIHRLLLDAPRGAEVDHINGNGLDNRRSNLRMCSHQQNCFNSTQRRHSSTPYKGVQRITNSSDKVWRAMIGHSGKRFHLGCFSTPEEAAMAYNDKARRLFGEYAKVNVV